MFRHYVSVQSTKSINNFIMLAICLTLLCVFLSSNAVKETVVHGSENYDAKLILDLIKRLGEPSYNYQTDQDEAGADASLPAGSNRKQSESASNELRNLQTCEPVIQQGSIIKTKESISAGADYVDSVKNVKSNADCLEYCCRNWTCDVAVYQDKGDRYCYLFRCDGQCIFKAHSGYFVSTIKSRKTEQPEEDLQSLNTEVAGPESDEKKPADGLVKKPADKQEITQAPAERTTVRAVATTETEAPELVITPHSVGLGGFCTQDRHCEDPNAVCGHGNCVCRNSYYNKDGICRKVCLKSEFECFELGTLSRGPECISQSQVCDSYLHCADGSDEFNCENIAPNSQQNNWVQQSESAVASQKGVSSSKNSDSADPYTQPVVQEPATDGRQQNAAPHQVNYQAPSQNYRANGDEMSLNKQQFSKPHFQNNDVRPKSTLASQEGSMLSNQNHYSGNAQSQPSIPNQYTNRGYVESALANTKFAADHDSNTNINPARKVLTNPESNSHQTAPKYNNPALNQQVDGLRQVNAGKLQRSGSPDGSPEIAVPSHTFQTGPQQMSDVNGREQDHLHQAAHDSPHQAGSSDGGQGNLYSSQLASSSSMKGQSMPQTLSSSNHESELKPDSRLHDDTLPNSASTYLQNSQPVDKSFASLQKPAASPLSSFKSSRLTNSHSQGSGGDPTGKSRSKMQSTNKSHPSSFDQASLKSKNMMSVPSYQNSQKWLDPSLYASYGLRDSSQQEQPQSPVASHYFDSSQYYPPYSSDSLDSMPESLLENAGSNDEFSQLGGSDLSRGRSLGLPYGGQNLGYQGYPDTSDGGQYAQAVRYDDSGDYRSPAYQDTDLYSPIANQRAFRPSAGLYEDFPSQVRPLKSSNVHKNPGSQLSLSAPKNNDAAVAAHGETTQAVKVTSNPSTPTAAFTSSKTQATTPAATNPPPAHKAQPQAHSEKKHIFMSSEKVIIASTSDAEGPIIALSLGLAFTVILLVLVGCRLRNVRHRLRKGRPLHQNEADYLINGMYL